ncbi:MAG: hypothetical protein IKM34_06570 [Clostridia bacterium]|nr:hypothetical protein [Clostridia bacterium]
MIQNDTVKKVLRTVGGFLVATLINFLLFYLMLPPINIFSRSFWFFLMLVLIIYGLVMGVFHFGKKKHHDSAHINIKGKSRPVSFVKNNRFSLIYTLLIPVPLVVIILGTLFSSTVFNATSYADVIEVNDEVFATDMPEVDEVTNIALLDTVSAQRLGARELGVLSDVVSQFVLSDKYTQINYQGRPMKVSDLGYDGFFKWLNNKDSGIPGYIMVDAVGNKAEYKKLAKNMVYSESAYFGENLERKLRFDYPTKIFDNISFEVDEEGNPFYIVSCSSPKVGLFGAMDISEVIIFNPINGSSTLYDVANVPKWVDVVYDGYLACEKYDWKGLYSGGYWNSIIGQKNCKQTTDDFGYLMLDDDVWYFTGVTSVTADESNIGFILSCARTGEYKFYPVIGAEEYSAMGAAEGEVQEKGYDASFPALVNIAGEPTYIMVLKDANQLVKLYALVNVEQYNLVATGETQASAISAYIKLLSQNGVDTSGSENNTENVTEITVADVQVRTLSGVTYYYLTAEDGKVYRVEFNEANEGIFFVKEGSAMKLSATINEKTGIYTVYDWEFTEEVSD